MTIPESTGSLFQVRIAAAGDLIFSSRCSAVPGKKLLLFLPEEIYCCAGDSKPLKEVEPYD
jgi:hypothetical protein